MKNLGGGHKIGIKHEQKLQQILEKKKPSIAYLLVHVGGCFLPTELICLITLFLIRDIAHTYTVKHPYRPQQAKAISLGMWLSYGDDQLRRF